MNFFKLILPSYFAGLLYILLLIPNLIVYIGFAIYTCLKVKTDRLNHVSNHANIMLLYLINFLVDVLAFIMVPIGLLFCDRNSEHLSDAFSLWDEPEYGINGDPYWISPEHANGHQREFMWRWTWLLRNKGIGLTTNHLGQPIGSYRKDNVQGDISISDQFGNPGVLYIETESEQGLVPCYYFVKQYWKLPFCLRIYTGWKTKDLTRLNWTAPYVFAVSLIKGFKS